MKYRLREHILNLTPETSRVVNDDIYIENGIVYITNHEYNYKYEHDCCFINVGGNWIDMQGGIPLYYVYENIDEDLFVPEEIELSSNMA